MKRYNEGNKSRSYKLGKPKHPSKGTKKFTWLPNTGLVELERETPDACAPGDLLLNSDKQNLLPSK